MPVFTRMMSSAPMQYIRGLSPRVRMGLGVGAAVGAGYGMGGGYGNTRRGSAGGAIGFGAAGAALGAAGVMGMTALRGNEAARTFMGNVTRPGVMKGMAGRMMRSLRG